MRLLYWNLYPPGICGSNKDGRAETGSCAQCLVLKDLPHQTGLAANGPTSVIQGQPPTTVTIGPCVDGPPLARDFRSSAFHWSRRPCVRPLIAAVSCAAGHDAFRANRVPTYSSRSKRHGPKWVFSIRRFQPAWCINSSLPFPTSFARSLAPSFYAAMGSGSR